MTAIRHYLPKVIVVDDGSADATATTAQAAGADVIMFAKSAGKGLALKVGWARAREQGCTWALNMDGDGQHSPADILTFFANAVPDEPALIVGNRMDNPSAMPWVRRSVNRWMSARLSRAAGLRLPDSQCGFRLMHLAPLAGVRSDHFEIESETLLTYARLGLPVRFVPIQVIYRPGGSNINPITDTFRWFRWFLRRG